MTDGELQSNQPEHALERPRENSTAKRVVEWFWRGSTLAQRRTATPAPSERSTLLAQRAKQSADLAQSAFASAEPLDGLTHANACELYRQAAYWALRALSVDSDSTSPTGEATGVYSESTWEGLDEQLLAQAASSPERLEGLRSALRTGSFVFFAELAESDQVALGGELATLVELLFRQLDRRARALHATYLERAWRLGLIAFGVLAIAATICWAFAPRDLALGMPWKASSKYAAGGCPSPRQQCAESPGFFFHTNEEREPWFELDLGAAHAVSSVEIENREDCCPERAVPLTVEVSTDHKSWQTVARRDAQFSKFRASFHSVQARWVRLRAHKQTFLHLSRVSIFQ